MSSITCSYKDNQILIKEEKNKNVKIKQVDLIDNIHYFEKKEEKFIIKRYENGSQRDFTDSQRILKYLDCLKDLKFVKKNMFPIFSNKGDTSIIGSTPIANLNKEYLMGLDNKIAEIRKVEKGGLEEAFTKKNKKEGFITHQSWLRETKISHIEEEKKFNIKNIFYEMGLDPKYYIKHNNETTYIRNVANDIIDPFLRSFQKERKNEIFGENVKIILDNSFFNFFGFNDTVSNYDYIYNKKSNKDGYEYNIDFNFENKKVVFNNTTNNFFLKGNTVKEDYLKNTLENDNNKKAFIVTKELGDVSQVLLMYIYCKYKNISAEDYTIVTEDMAVYLLCQMLKQSCIFPEFVEKIIDIKQLKRWLPELVNKTEITEKIEEIIKRINENEQEEKKDKTQIRKLYRYIPEIQTPGNKTPGNKTPGNKTPVKIVERQNRDKKGEKKRFIDQLEKNKQDVENYNNTHIQMLFNLIENKKFYLDTRYDINDNHVLLLKYLISKIRKENEKLTKLNFSLNENVGDIDNEINKHKVPLIFNRMSENKINQKVRIDNKDLDYAIEMQEILKRNRVMDARFKFGMENEEENIKNISKTANIDIKMIDETVKEPANGAGFLSEISYRLYNTLVEHKKTLFSSIYNLFYKTGGKTRKNKKRLRRKSVKGGNNDPFDTNIKMEFLKEELKKIKTPEEFDYVINIFQYFTSSEYGYSILEEFLQLNILQQIYTLCKTAEYKNKIKFFMNSLNTTGIEPPKKEYYVEYFFEEIYTFLCREFYDNGEVLYDDDLLEKIKKFIEPIQQGSVKPLSVPKIMNIKPENVQQSSAKKSKNMVIGTPINSKDITYHNSNTNIHNSIKTNITRKRKTLLEDFNEENKQQRLLNQTNSV